MGATFNPVNGKTLTGTIRKAIENLLNKKKHSLKVKKALIKCFICVCYLNKFYLCLLFKYIEQNELFS